MSTQSSDRVMANKGGVQRGGDNQNPNQRDEMAEIRRQIAALTELVQQLRAPAGGSDASDDFQSQVNVPFGVPHGRRAYPDRVDHKWENNIKVEVPEFQGGLNPDNFVDWLNSVERVFDYYEVSEAKKVKLVSLCLKGRASAW